MMFLLKNQFKYIVLVLITLFLLANCFKEKERISLRNEVREMFIHAYDSYMKYAYPADELMPLSCKGRYRNVEISRGDVDDALGNFSLTLIDTLDSLAILGNYSEFEKALHLVIDEVNFDSDIVVSVFETNIRVLGGLLSAHILALQLKIKKNLLLWYNDQLLTMAQDIGNRLLLAFNTSTGIPHPRVNLKYGMNSSKIGSLKETCTSCAGTMILEFAALSRLTGKSIFEIKARKAMDYLWNQRHRQSDLVGNIINIDTGDWIRKESGVGAGIDSYYEYCLKAYILLGDENYLDRFNRHYAGIMKYVSYGPFLIDVHMHRPHNQAKNFMDSLLAFWPGLQVLKGDLKPAIETHEILYQVTKKHNFLPEAFTVDFNIHWPHHPLRPEFIESTYFLYLATKDDHYLQVGKNVLNNLQNFTRVHCGFAAVNDVRTKKKEDRMDSFFLAETLKYLYLLFSNKYEIDFNLDEYVFTTEAHLLPLSLSYTNSSFVKNDWKFSKNPNYIRAESDYNCPTTKEFFKKSNINKNIDSLSYYKLLRMNAKDFLSNRNCLPQKKISKIQPRIRASQFSATKPDHVDLLRQLGINVVTLKDGRVQLIHNSAAAQSSEAAEEGSLFMQEMISLSQQQKQYEYKLRAVSFVLPNNIKISLLAGPAQFGSEVGENIIESLAVKLNPFDGCNLEKILNKNLMNKIAIVKRGDCMFIEKARNVQKLGAVGMIIVDNVENSSSKYLPMFSMSGDGSTDVIIQSVFLYSEDAKILLNSLEEYPLMKIKLENYIEDFEENANSNLSIVQKIEDESNVSTNNYIQELTNIFNLFKSNKLKFDLLSAFNLKDFKEKNANIFLSILKNIALPSSMDIINKKEKVVLKKTNAKLNYCINPYRKPSDFIKHLNLLFICTNG